MEQIAWATLGVLAVAVFGTFGGLFYLGSRLDALGSRVDALGERLDARIDSLAGQLQDHIQRHTS